MVVIPCPGSHTFTSNKTRTSWGVFRESNRRSAKTRAENAVSSDLVSQINNSSCANGCLMNPPQTTVNPATVTCERKWYTFWIVIKCTGRSTGESTVECRVMG
ncbi:hypothetical protein C6990_00085 [Nitrosopumilus sp. b3]|uniref:hypothetical protein n=1 Tax=Nitrosopumilus sp. b3 TaxID=2109909 RepID=UPI0015F68A81|nr:hypothetical protein [Nitrosopumilus sp. b3]KAF6247896.1 hypothetical protein C6990_00085 [Nitrosopumilus sp. b3]